jgi:CMP-N,N'-diacetyllegionaminic acid synthase
MKDGKRILAVVPARGGSKGVALKNLRAIGGIPMVALAGKLLGRLEWLDRAVVSTDHEEIARIAEQSGLDAPFRRPEHLSGDQIGDLEVLVHALTTVEEKDDRRYDIVLMIQPTCPLRKIRHVSATVEKLVAGGYDAVWTVSMTDSKAHPLKQLVISNERLAFYDKEGAQIIARQQLAPVYHRNGAAYAITRSCLLEQRSIMGANPSALIIDEFLPNIDTEFDIEFATFLLHRNGPLL